MIMRRGSAIVAGHLAAALILVAAGCGGSVGEADGNGPGTDTVQPGDDAAVPGDDVAGIDSVAPQPTVPDEPLQTENSMSEEKGQMAQYYAPLEYQAEAEIEPYALPLSAGDVANWEVVVGALGLDGKTDKLLANGFVVVPYGDEEDIAAPYRVLKDMEVPFFVTVDTWLHLYHVQFDELLMTLEEEIFYADIVAVTDALLASAEKLYGGSDGLLKEAAKRNVAFLRVARELFVVADDATTKPASPVPDYVADTVAAELKLIEGHQGFVASPLFVYKEDYSQYVPRGHYTRSEKLKAYFKGMMWYGRLAMLLKGGEPACEFDDCPALILPADADAQTVQALLLSLDLAGLDAGGEAAKARWERIYQATSFFVGLADNLTFYEYLDTVTKVLGGSPALTALTEADNLFDIRADLAQKRSPQIYGGTGGQVIIVEPGEEVTPDMLDKLLDKSKGFRLMGQRFIPDSYVMGRLVSPGAGLLKEGADGSVFTAVLTDVGIIRGFPRGLDVMAVMGSQRARDLLAEYGDDQYTKFDKTFGEMASFLASQTPEQWHANLYWGWLDAIRTLLEPAGPGHQTFMQTPAYTDRWLTASLASWSQLRHDTILYAKQSYTPGFETSIPEPVTGYVEPNAAFFASLLSLNEMTLKGLDDMGMLPQAAKKRLTNLSTALQRMLDIVLVELEGKPLEEADVWYIDGLADTLDKVVAGVEEQGVKTTLIADVHTDQNSEKVLEEGTGYVELLVAAYRLPNGNIGLGAGPVLSYYEFKHPMDDRLTDEKWREILGGPAADVPAQPEWTTHYRQE
jgi:hypothetical protein